MASGVEWVTQVMLKDPAFRVGFCYRRRSQEWDIFPEIGEAIQRAGLHVHMSNSCPTACSHAFPQRLYDVQEKEADSL